MVSVHELTMKRRTICLNLPLVKGDYLHQTASHGKREPVTARKGSQRNSTGSVGFKHNK